MGNAAAGARQRVRAISSAGDVARSLARRFRGDGGHAADGAALSPCAEPFPDGLGPLSVRCTRLVQGDVTVINIDASADSRLQITPSFFERSDALRMLRARLEREGTLSPSWEDPDGEATLELLMSPPHAVHLPPHVCESLGIVNAEEVHFAWVYPSVLSAAEEDAGEGDADGLPAGGRRDRFQTEADEVLDPDDADVSFLTVGGYIYFRIPAACQATYCCGVAGSGPSEGSGTSMRSRLGSLSAWRRSAGASASRARGGSSSPKSADGPGSPSESSDLGDTEPRRGAAAELEVLKALSIRFSTRGAFQFSAPCHWEPSWTRHLSARGRFHPVTARKWTATGASHFCWVRPDELLPNDRGLQRPFAHHGGFAFLFHDPEEEPKEGRPDDRYFEIVAAPDFPEEPPPPTRPPTPEVAEPEPSPKRRLARVTSLPFNLTATPPGYEAKLLEKVLDLARSARWLLVMHLLAEYQHLASKAGKGGVTLLHVCGEGPEHPGKDLLELLKNSGASCEVEDEQGRRPDDLGDASFRALVRQVWRLSPDVFDDPEAWFTYWDSDCSGVLDVDQLCRGLCLAFHCDEVGAQWVKSYVHIHHPAGVSRADLLSDDDEGLLRVLQTSDEFAGLRQKKTAPLFDGVPRQLSDAESSQLARIEDQLAHLRARFGWETGKPAPSRAQPLPLPVPCAEGSADPASRLASARQILGFTFEQTRNLPGLAWQAGFRIDFAGQEGLDDGGLTKAWVNEVACALWGDSELFEVRGNGSFFKPDRAEWVRLDSVPVRTVDLYRWTGRFLAYALYQRCLMDCRLCAWAFRCLLRAAEPRHFFQPRGGGAGACWPETPEGEDAMLEDLASLDHVFASNLWRVRHELSAEELRWLDFTCSGDELEAGGADHEVTPENKAAYVRRCCTAMLMQRCGAGLQAFIEGFFEVVPAKLVSGAPEEGLPRLLTGNAQVTDSQLAELERTVVPGGLVPVRLREHPRVREAASWVFRVAREGDVHFRSRLLEFWIGIGRAPLAGLSTVQPRPKLQLMVQTDRGGQHVKRISSWPRHRLPEGHTCGNELWMALPDSYEECASKLHTAVGNFEAGFSLR